MKRKVRVRSDLVVDERYSDIYFTEEMAEFKGKEVTIATNFRIKEDEGLWVWSPEMFEDEPSSDCPFKRGDEVEVWDSDSSSYSSSYEVRIFIAYISGAYYPYLCVIKEDEKKFRDGESFGVLHWKHCRPRRPDLKVNDPVWVWDEIGDRPKRRLFAKWSDGGKIECFVDGLNSWTSNGESLPWKYWRLPTEEELKGDNHA